MDKLFFKLFLIILLALGAFYYTFPWTAYNMQMPFSGGDYRLGLDLQGGVELDYKVDLSEVQKEEGYTVQRENSIIEGLKSIVDKRVENLNINDSSITTASYGGEKHIIVQIPLKGTNKEENDLNIKRAKEAIGKVMKIEFKEARTEVTQQDLELRKQISLDLLKEATSSEYNFSVIQAQYKDTYENISVGTLSGTLTDLSKYFTIDTSKIKSGIFSEVLSGTGLESYTFSSGEVQSVADSGNWILDIKSFSGEVLNFDYAFVSSQPSAWKPAQDSQGRVLNDKYFENSSVQYNQAYQPMVELTFNTEGTQIFGELTQRLKGQQIAIFVGGEMLTAPVVNDVILTGKAVITGNYTAQEAAKLSNDINTGVVPAPIYLTSERTIDSKLGAHSLQQLIVAGIYGFALIFIFLIAVYRFPGFLVGIALIIYTALVLVVVKMFGIVLTLAGIAGIILSIGIAIDSNILIFSRIKDSLLAGHSLEKSIKEGFEQSWSAIWDSNLTGLIISIVLFIFGVNMIKGFGLMLGIGIVISLFSSIFISRLFILVSVKKNIHTLKKYLGVDIK